MKRFIPVLLLTVLLSSCLSLSFLGVPNEALLKQEMAPYIQRHGDYTGYQVQHILKDENQECQVYVLIAWIEKEIYVIFTYLNSEWFPIEGNG